jgi:ATP synthase protein I
MPVMTDAEQARLEALEKRIAAAKAAHAPKAKPQSDGHSQAQMAWRMVIELVAGLMIGFGIGYGLDTLLGTKPVFLVLFILVGFAAGIKTMLRSAKEMQAKGLAEMDANAAPVVDDEKDD